MENLDFQQIINLPENAASKERYEKYNEHGREVSLLILLQDELQVKLWGEMQGQISDGNWEHSRHTEWLWGGTELALMVPGLEKPQVIFKHLYLVGKKNYFMHGDLKQIIGEDVTGRCGYKDVATMVKNWNLIARAIKNVQIQPNLVKDSFESVLYGSLDMGYLQATQRNKKLKEDNEKKWNEERAKILSRLHILGYDTCGESMESSKFSHFEIDFGKTDLTDKAVDRILGIRLTLTGCCNNEIEVETNGINYFQFTGKFVKVSIKDVFAKIVALIRCVDGDYPEQS